MITRVTDVGVFRSVAWLVVLTGSSFNLSAAIYLFILLLSLTQALGIPLTLEQQVSALGVMLLTWKGMASVPGSSSLGPNLVVLLVVSGRFRCTMGRRRGLAPPLAPSGAGYGGL